VTLPAVCAAILGFSGFVMGFKNHNIYINLILMLVLSSLVIIGISDIKYTIIPDQFVVLIFICAAALFVLYYFFNIITFYNYFLSPAFGAIIGGGSMLLMSLIGRIFYKKDVLGFGDVKLFFVCGLLVGTNGAIFCFISTIVIAAVFFLINMLLKRLSLASLVPLGPFICISTALFILFNTEIGLFTKWYLTLF
jgi:prepilin signal peptidase PulO-like enzyme (type II secretory pathway)